MATTLDADQEALVHFSFPIASKEDTDSINPVDGTPDIWIVGKATDGTIDADRQIVDPEWSAVALKEWVATNGNVRMAHDPKRPVGKGHNVQCTMDGHYVRSLISDPLAKHFIRTGVLSDYSVGISNPHIKYGPHKALDPRGEASGGIITGRPDGLSKIAELSVVDRGANFNSKFQIAKSAGGGAEFTGRMIGDEDEITKAAPPALLTKAIAPAPAPADVSRFGFAEDLSVTFTPNDMARLMQAKFVEKHYAELAAQAAGVEKRDFDRNVGGGVDRDKLDDSDFAGKNRSFPIVTQADVSDALQSIGRAGDDNYDAATLRRNIISIARRKGFSVPDDSGSSSKGAEEVAEPVAEKSDAPTETEAAVPDVTKEPDSKDAPVKKAKGKKKKLPPWLNKPADGDDDGKGSGDNGDDDGASKACKSFLDHAWIPVPDGYSGGGPVAADGAMCSKCHTTPAQAAGVTASPMDPAPVGDLMESSAPASVKAATPQSASGASDAAPMKPVPAHREPDGAAAEAFEADAGMSDGDSEGGSPSGPAMKASGEVAALLRFKHAGIDADLGRLHDLTCPAYHPDEVAKYHPFADLASLIDEGAWARKALDAATGPLEQAVKMDELHRAALALKGADEADLNDWRLEAHKAFRDANPGPATYPTPGAVSAQRYNRPVLTDGRAANSPGYAGPNTSPLVATSAPDAHSFGRPPLASAHASPSPSFMKWGSGEYPSQTGVPTQLHYAHVDKDRARMALVQMHDHLSRQFPEVCPLDTVSLDGRADRPLRGVQPERHPVPATAGIGKAAAGGFVQTAGAGDSVPPVLDNGYMLPKSAARVITEQVHNGEITVEQARDVLTKSAPSPAPVAAFKAQPEDGADMFADADVYKSFKKMRKRLGKKVLAGKMTVDEARAKMGRQFAQKGSSDEDLTALAVEQVRKGISSIDEVRERLDLPPWGLPETGTAGVRVPSGPAPAAPPVAAALDSEVIKAAVAEATSELKDLLVKQQRDMAAQQESFTAKLAETQRVIDAIADQPDPSTAAFHGLAFNPVRKSAARPAGVTEIAEAAARARRATERELENLYNSATDPYAREGYYATLTKMRGGAPDS